MRRGLRLTLLTTTAATLVLAGCSTGGDSSPASPTSDGPSRAAEGWAVPAAKAVTAADLPGFTVQPVGGVASMASAADALQSMAGYRYDPADCKAKDVKGVRDVQETVLSGRRLTVARGGGEPGFVITMLPASDVRIDVFAAAATGQCAVTTVTAGDTVTERSTRREPLPAGVTVPEGFVLETVAKTTRGGEHAEQTAVTAYLTKDGVTMLVAVQSAPGHPVDRATFGRIVATAAAKL